MVRDASVLGRLGLSWMEEGIRNRSRVPGTLQGLLPGLHLNSSQLQPDGRPHSCVESKTWRRSPQPGTHHHQTQTHLRPLLAPNGQQVVKKYHHITTNRRLFPTIYWSPINHRGSFFKWLFKGIPVFIPKLRRWPLKRI